MIVTVYKIYFCKTMKLLALRLAGWTSSKLLKVLNAAKYVFIFTNMGP